MNNLTVVPKTLTVPVWVLYSKQEDSSWKAIAAFISKPHCDAWCNDHFNTLPKESMGYFCSLYATRAPHTINCYSDNRFEITVEEDAISVIDVADMPDVLPMLEAAATLVNEYIRYGKGDAESWVKARALVRAITEDHLLLTSKFSSLR